MIFFKKNLKREEGGEEGRGVGRRKGGGRKRGRREGGIRRK